MNISYSFGMVDLMHFGHINALKKASEKSDLNIFGLVSDEASDAWFGAHVSDESERRTVLESIKYVDEVWPQSTFDPLDNLRIIHTKYPDATISLFTGNEWGIISAKRYVESIGGHVVRLDYYDKLSPQSILDVINKNETKGRPLWSNLISTKANTLQALKGMLTKARIEDICIITVGDFMHDGNQVSKGIQERFTSGSIVVRSSSKREDAFEESNAGHFTSILDVDASDVQSIMHAVSAVIRSYGEDVDDDEQVLIQRQTEEVLVSGVVFTRDIRRNRPYYVINYDTSGSTDAVTSGMSGASAWISYSISRNDVPAKWKPLMEAVWELEDILTDILLDIEFAITPTSVVIFQVRPLAAAYKFGRNGNDQVVEDVKKKIVWKYRKLAGAGLTCFSDMAFWNPAEMIGDSPRNLDFSLYREIITKSAWNTGLLPIGYRTVPGELMYRFGSKPYVSVEKSFEALIPNMVSDHLASKLCDYYVDRLRQDLSAHDKIEFEISHNCFDFSTHSRLARLMADGFSTEEVLELENALKALTLRVIRAYPETVKSDMEHLKHLESMRLDLQNVTDGSENIQLVAKSVHTILDAVEKHGTAQFSRHARCAFIAKSLCRSLVEEGYVDPERMDRFMSGIRTVAVDYDRDYHAVRNGEMTYDTFIRIYGHLRAGTYNIRSPRYDQMGQIFADTAEGSGKVGSYCMDANLDGDVGAAIERAMADAGLEELTGAEVVSFIKLATEKREYFKFIFTKSLSFAIELIKQIGGIAGVGVDQLSYLELPEVYAAEYYSDIDRLREFWSLIIEKRQELCRVHSEMILPSVICSELDFDCIENIASRPNYITENQAEGDVAVLAEGNEGSDPLDGKVVVIEKADPGYDWIFTKGIAGLVTKYGGAASHMAIRCAEFRIPAAIGCGTVLYEYATESKRLVIDCKNERLIRIR